MAFRGITLLRRAGIIGNGFSIPDRTVYCITFPSDQSIHARFEEIVTQDRRSCSPQFTWPRYRPWRLINSRGQFAGPAARAGTSWFQRVPISPPANIHDSSLCPTRNEPCFTKVAYKAVLRLQSNSRSLLFASCKVYLGSHSECGDTSNQLNR